MNPALSHITYYRPQVFEGIERVLSPWSAPWFSWWVFGAFACLIVAVIFTPGLLKSRAQMLLGLQKRQSIFSQTSITDLRTIIGATLFTIISVALALYLWSYSPDRFSQQGFLAALVVVTVWLIAKAAVISLLYYVFFDVRRMGEIWPTVAQCHFFAALGLFAAVCMRLFLPDNWELASQIMLIITMLAYAIMIVVKMVQHFLSKTIDFLHIFLYLCTIEFLPAALIVKTFGAFW